MARKVKIGLDYFPHSCTLDDELEYIIAVHKEIGYYVYFRLLERIYKNLGYYIKWDKKNIALFSNSINVDINKINDIINDCLSEYLFNKNIHKKYNIITSKGIQERYFEAIERRKEVEIINEYILLKDVYINSLNVNINWLNVDKSTQSKVYKSKKDNNKFDLVFLDFEKMRIKLKKPLTEKAKELLIKKLNKLSNDEETQILILEESIINSWQGIFPLKDNNKKTVKYNQLEEQAKRTEEKFKNR